MKNASHFGGESKKKTRNLSRVEVMTIAFNLAEPVLLHCGCSQVTSENTQFQVQQSESVGQHRHLAGICDYNIVLPPCSSWSGTTLLGNQAQSPRRTHMRALPFLLPHRLHHHLGESTVPSGLPARGGQMLRDRAAPPYPPLLSLRYLFLAISRKTPLQ